MIEDYKGDSAVYKFTVTDKVTKEAIIISGWALLAEFGDGTNEIKKANIIVAGGADNQIKITDATNGKFEVYLNKGETLDFDDEGYLEVATLEGGKDTLIRIIIIFKKADIDWEVP